MIKKIISGGQTGADQGGLEAGKILGLETGGTAPKYYQTETGPNLKLKTEFGLQECNIAGYYERTYRNIIFSDCTVLFGNMNSPGSKLTLHLCEVEDKAYLINPTEKELIKWLEEYDIQILNVAGNRESKNPGIQTRVRDFLIRALD